MNKFFGRNIIMIGSSNMATKTPVEKAIEKQMKQAKQDAINQRRQLTAQSVVSGQNIVNGFRIMDTDSEMTLKALLERDVPAGKEFSFSYDLLPEEVRASASLQMEKLYQYGMLSRFTNATYAGILILSNAGFTYFQDKAEALKRAETVSAESERNKRIYKEYDVFISHASADKEDYVDLLVMTVKRLGINVFYDKDSISWGDNWKQAILSGTANSEFAIIVISKNFFDREWTEKELDEFLHRQNESGQKIVLPLLLGITVEEMKAKYPTLSEIQCISADRLSREEVVIFLAREIIKRYR